MIGDEIKRLRLLRNLSLSELASRANVAKSYLSSIERGLQQNPSLDVLNKLANELNVQVTHFLSHAEKENLLDDGWLQLAKEAMDSGMTKKELRDFIEYHRWRHQKEHQK
ncbi:helix-turn-helix domain-containing protein [Bacillaceae bacterium SIJ1]|uniref:helix-turn-helix domain-containing protein n=1 Tax=Litoribacterium kuwaitense TaxID=1398745 RepID=UPI0013EA92D2|nr:helix-turn-helix domain-containing protein [Litoribacterium kuwaitense]NGP44508.1 helix-turn-helix domain-containing protein [Litoribacterium kuwaitense]